MSSKYTAYPEYKNSGVEWLGEIPKNWNVTRLKHLAQIKNGQDYKGVEAASGYPVMGSGGQFTYATTFVYDKESVLLGRKGTIDKPLYINEPFWTVDTMYYTVINKGIPAKYLHYLALTIQFDRYSTNTALPSMTQEHLGNYIFGIPVSEQERVQIANFLDHETGNIDTLIEEQKTLIRLLQEKRQAVISHAVTKGLNPDVPLKDSGVEWLGQVPEHWEVNTISQSSRKITNGYVGPTRDILVESGIPYVQATHIKNGKVNFDNAYFVTEPWSQKHAKSILKKDDVLIVQTGAGTGDVGLVLEEQEGYNCHALIIVQPVKKRMSGEFLSSVLSSSYGYAVLYSIRTGGMHPHLNCGEVKFVRVPCPPLDEQLEINVYLQGIRDKFSDLKVQAEKQIILLQERRTALISAAVTGKIDVRDWVEPTQKQQKHQPEAAPCN